jgi:hypothetical protein
MSSSCRLALLLTLALATVPAAPAQSSTSSSSAPAQAQQSVAQSQGALSVQARIKARREQRRLAAIHDAYAHRYEAYAGMGYMYFPPGLGVAASPGVAYVKPLERTQEYAWNVGLTRYINERLGITLDGRGYYGSAYVYNNVPTNSGITNPAISQYSALIGPTYRFYLQPKVSVSGRVLGGFIRGNFSGDTNHSTILSAALGLWPDEYTYAAQVSLPVEYNVSPNFSLRFAPEYVMTGFGSTTQSNIGASTGFVYRFGKQ